MSGDWVLTQQKVGMTVTTSMRMEVQPDVVMDQLVHRLEAYVLADHVASDKYTETVTFERPATTWQMFKSQHAGSWWLGWLVERRPVRVAVEQRGVTVHVDRYLRYPESNMALPQLGSPVIFESVNRRAW